MTRFYRKRHDRHGTIQSNIAAGENAALFGSIHHKYGEKGTKFMQTIIKRTAALLLAACVVLAGLGNLAGTALAAESRGSYVLHYDDEGQPYLYGSLYECKHSYNDPEAGSSWTYYNAPEIFNLVYEGDNGNHSVAAYCTDADTSTISNDNIYYRRINLEDSTYHVSGAAARLRAVVLHSFPYLSVETVAENVNQALGADAIQQLTQGEVLSATQQAIWEITHGEKYNVDKNYAGMRSQHGYDRSQFVYPESLDACVESEFTATNIQQLYQYFLNLPGQVPMADAISEYSFKNVVYNATREDDGTYTVTVTYTVDANLQDGDNLSLTTVCGEKSNQDALKTGDGSVTFSGLTEKLPVTLTISGTQTGADVYLFDADGDRGVSQSMVGYDSTTLPVLAQVTAEPDREINIYKSTSEGENKRPLANIEFEIYLVATMEDIVTGKVKLSEKPTEVEIAAYTTGNPLVTLKTDAQGFASYNMTDHDYPDGVYLVVEKENEAVVCPVEPFFVAIPGTNEDGTGHSYTVTVHPKNTVEVGPEIRKDVTQIDRDEDTFDVNENHTWIIRSDIPAGIANAVKYVISDALDYRLTLKNHFEVKVGLKTDRAGDEAVTLIPGTDYTIDTVKAVDAENRGIDTFTVSLTASGMEAAAKAAPVKSDYEIRVYFDAVIDSDAQLGVAIPNRADLQYINETGIMYDAESDVPKVYTGGTGILKLDSATGDALKDASFKIARDATNAEIDNGQSVALTVEDEERQVIFATFYADEALTNPVQEYTTGEDGKILMYGLAYGTYYILETKAPSGYNLLTEPVIVEIDADSHLEEEIVTVYNTKFLLPETGGIGTGIFTTFGVIFIGGAFALSLCCLKKKEN